MNSLAARRYTPGRQRHLLRHGLVPEDRRPARSLGVDSGRSAGSGWHPAQALYRSDSPASRNFACALPVHLTRQGAKMYQNGPNKTKKRLGSGHEPREETLGDSTQTREDCNLYLRIVKLRWWIGHCFNERGIWCGGARKTLRRARKPGARRSGAHVTDRTGEVACSRPSGGLGHVHARLQMAEVSLQAVGAGWNFRGAAVNVHPIPLLQEVRCQLPPRHWGR